MSKSKFIIILLLFFSFISIAQEKYSLQINAGLIHPDNQSSGPSSTIRINYNYNENYKFYLSTGYSNWDKNHVNYNYLDFIKPGDFPLYQSEIRNSFDEFDHHLIPLEVGLDFLGLKNKFFVGFLEAELGVNFLSYKSKELQQVTYPDGDIDYTNLNSPVENKNDVFFSVALGIGAMRQFGDYGNISLSYRLTYAHDKSKNDAFLHHYFSTFYLGYEFSI